MTDVYALIHDNVVEQLKHGTIPWVKCFHVDTTGCAYSHSTGNPYSWMNQFLLKLTGEYWTFNQATKSGYSIRKGCHASNVFFWKTIELKDKSDEDNKRLVPMLKRFLVFHESDIVGLPEKTEGMTNRNERNAQSIEDADAMVCGYLKQSGIMLHTSSRVTPCWSVGEKMIRMPEKCQFDSLQEYYAALFHEMIHSTAQQLERKHDYDDTKQRAREELVAEIGSAYLCGRFGITESVIKNQSAYCKSWLTALDDDIRALVWASSRAEKAAKLILGETSDEEINDVCMCN